MLNSTSTEPHHRLLAPPSACMGLRSRYFAVRRRGRCCTPGQGSSPPHRPGDTVSRGHGHEFEVSRRGDAVPPAAGVALPIRDVSFPQTRLHAASHDVYAPGITRRAMRERVDIDGWRIKRTGIRMCLPYAAIHVPTPVPAFDVTASSNASALAASITTRCAGALGAKTYGAAVEASLELCTSSSSLRFRRPASRTKTRDAPAPTPLIAPSPGPPTPCATVRRAELIPVHRRASNTTAVRRHAYRSLSPCASNLDFAVRRRRTRDQRHGPACQRRVDPVWLSRVIGPGAHASLFLHIRAAVATILDVLAFVLRRIVRAAELSRPVELIESGGVAPLGGWIMRAVQPICIQPESVSTLR